MSLENALQLTFGILALLTAVVDGWHLHHVKAHNGYITIILDA